MTKEQWSDLKHFFPWENWGIWQKIDYKLLWCLDQYVDYIKGPGNKNKRRFIVTSGTQGKHDSQWHAKGLAIDGILVLNGVSAFDAYLDLLKFPFTGVGLYPHWKLRGEGDDNIIGFHVDGRPVSRLPTGVIQARWMGITKADGTRFNGVAIKKKSLRQYGII